MADGVVGTSASDLEEFTRRAEAKKQAFESYLSESKLMEVVVEATAAMFDNREYPECPREFLARAVYPKVFEDCEGLRAQVKQLQAKLDKIAANHKKAGRKSGEVSFQ